MARSPEHDIQRAFFDWARMHQKQGAHTPYQTAASATSSPPCGLKQKGCEQGCWTFACHYRGVGLRVFTSSSRRAATPASSDQAIEGKPARAGRLRSGRLLVYDGRH